MLTEAQRDEAREDSAARVLRPAAQRARLFAAAARRHTRPWQLQGTVLENAT